MNQWLLHEWNMKYMMNELKTDSDIGLQVDWLSVMFKIHTMHT